MNIYKNSFRTVSNVPKSMTEEQMTEVNLELPSPSGSHSSSTTHATPSRGRTTPTRKEKNIDLTIVEALNRINPAPEVTVEPINTTCQTISSILGKMPLKERVALEIELLKKAYDGAKDFL